MAALGPKPPDLDANGRPVGTTTKPPDLDANGRPVIADSTPTIDAALGAQPGESSFHAAVRDALGAILSPIGGLRALLQEAKGTKAVSDAAAAHPVETGALLGGAAAAPLTGGTSLLPAVAAAGLGGAGGAGLGEIEAAATGSEPVPNTAGGVVGEMAKQGAVQAGAELGGRGVQAATAPLARRLYGYALGAPTALRQEFETLPETGIREAVPVSKGGRMKTGVLLKQSSQQATDLLRAAESARPNVAGYLPTATEDVPLGVAPAPQGGSVALQPAVQTMSRKVGPVGNAQELLLRQWEPVYGGEGINPPTAVADTVAGPGVLRRRLGVSEAPAGPGAPPGMIDPRAIATTGLGPVATELAGRGLKSRALGELSDLTGEFLADHPVPLSLMDANTLKQTEQNLSTAAYHARDTGGIPLSVADQFHEGLASGARQQIENIVPAVGPINARTQELIGLDRALTRRLGLLDNRSPIGMQHPINIGVAGALGGGAGYGSGNTNTGLTAGGLALLTAESLTNPGLASREAIMLSRLGRVPLSQAIRAAIMARLAVTGKATAPTPAGQPE